MSALTGHSSGIRGAAGGETSPMRLPLLLVTGIEGIEATASALAGKLGCAMEIASTRAAAVRLLERRCYALVVMDQLLADTDVEGTDLVWRSAGLAIPLQFSFALAGSERLEREIRAAMARRRREQELTRTAAAAALDAELKNAVTGLLLESQLALAEEQLPPRVEIRLRKLAGLAEQLRETLTGPLTMAALATGAGSGSGGSAGSIREPGAAVATPVGLRAGGR